MFNKSFLIFFFLSNARKTYLLSLLTFAKSRCENSTGILMAIPVYQNLLFWKPAYQKTTNASLNPGISNRNLYLCRWQLAESQHLIWIHSWVLSHLNLSLTQSAFNQSKNGLNWTNKMWRGTWWCMWWLPIHVEKVQPWTGQNGYYKISNPNRMIPV